MIEYIIPENPDFRILTKVKQMLLSGGVICFPTDTNWVLAADPFVKAGVEKLYRLKGADKKKHLSLLCSSLQELSRYALISNSYFRILKRKLPGPYTFIFKPSQDLPRALRSYRDLGEIGIRYPNSLFCQKMLQFWEQPLLVTSLSPHMLDIDLLELGIEQLYAYLIEESVLGPQIDLILDPGDIVIKGPSTVVDFSDEEQGAIIIREGAGDLDF